MKTESHWNHLGGIGLHNLTVCIKSFSGVMGSVPFNDLPNAADKAQKEEHGVVLGEAGGQAPHAIHHEGPQEHRPAPMYVSQGTP